MCKFSNNSFCQIAESFKESKVLESLTLKNCLFTLEEIKSLSGMISHNSSLIKLNLSNTILDTQSLTIIGEGCSINKGSLKILLLNETLIESTNTAEFLSFLSKSHLEEIQLLGNKFNSNFGVEIFEFFRNCVTLNKIKIGAKEESFNDFGNQILLGLSESSRIRKMTIENIIVDSYLFENLVTKNPELRVLQLSNFEKDSLYMNFLSLSKSLKVLTLTVRNFDEKDATVFGDLVKHLEFCKIRVNSLDSLVAERIVEGLKDNNNIKFFELFREDFYDKSFEKVLFNYYNYVTTCNELTNIQIVYIPDSRDANDKEKRNIAVNLFKEFFNKNDIKEHF
jgi:hypothetical protein